MYRPGTNLDDSAQYEKSLAERARAITPPVDLTRVNLEPFTLKAKIDCITISFPWELTGLQFREMNALMGERVKAPQDRRGSLFITVHDPTLADLRYLMKEFPDQRVDHLEIAVDARLPPGSNDVYLLRVLKEQIRHCIAPQTHEQFRFSRRQYFDLGTCRLKDDAARYATPLTTVTYKDKKSGMSMKIYLKTRDQNQVVANPFVRTELTLDGVGPDWAGLSHVKDLPDFVERMRKFCTPAFNFGCGYKKGDPDGSVWRRYGAVWTIKIGKGLVMRRDTAVNIAFGEALNTLRRSLVAL